MSYAFRRKRNRMLSMRHRERPSQWRSQVALMLIKHQQRVIAEHGHGVHLGRFTVLLRWQRGAPATNRELSVFCSHYGPVRAHGMRHRAAHTWGCMCKICPLPTRCARMDD